MEHRKRNREGAVFQQHGVSGLVRAEHESAFSLQTTVACKTVLEILAGSDGLGGAGSEQIDQDAEGGDIRRDFSPEHVGVDFQSLGHPLSFAAGESKG